MNIGEIEQYLKLHLCLSADGKRLSLEELWNRVPVEYQHRIENHKWATLTQQVTSHLRLTVPIPECNCK